jgi:hypothetical protein
LLTANGELIKFTDNVIRTRSARLYTKSTNSACPMLEPVWQMPYNQIGKARIRRDAIHYVTACVKDSPDMNLTRRQWLTGTACAAGYLGAQSLGTRPLLPGSPNAITGFESLVPRSFSITPIVFDGKWNWSEQPAGQSGYLDPREFEIRAGIRWRSSGTARNVRGTTVVPVAFPEQEFIDVQIEKPDECQAKIVKLTESSAQLQVYVPAIERGQTVTVAVVGRMKLFRHCPKYSKEQFPNEQIVPTTVAAEALGNSPGIRSESSRVRRLVESIISRHDHPWTKAKKIFDWVWENIQGKPGAYTSVEAALQNRVGDCEERAGVFVAFCRVIGIPARLVLVPNHCWAEFCLSDGDGVTHWIAAHTAAYNWFGWTGTHELVLQKGDRIYQPGLNKTNRLICDWVSWEGRRPTTGYFGELTPIEGPGQRIKNSLGGWDLSGRHADNHFLRA